MGKLIRSIFIENKFPIIFCLSLVVITTIADLGILYVLGKSIDVFIDYYGKGDVIISNNFLLLVLFLAFIVVSLLKLLKDYVSDITVKTNIYANLQKRIAENIIFLSIRKNIKNSIYTASQLMQGVRSLGDYYSALFTSLIPMGLGLLGVIVLLFNMNMYVSMFIFLWISTKVMLAVFILRHSEKLTINVVKNSSKLNSLFSEIIENSYTLSRHLGQKEIDYLTNDQIELNRTVNREKSMFFLKMNFVTNILDGIFISILLTIFLFLHSSGDWSVGDFSLGVAILIRVWSETSSFGEVSYLISNFNGSIKSYASEIFRLGISDGNDKKISERFNLKIESTPIIEFMDVVVSFSDTKKFDTVLKNISFRIRPGCNVAIVGASGSGKSTLLKVISGEIIPNKGNVVFLYEGNEYIPAEISNRISVLLQENNLLDRSVIDNIDINRSNNEEKLKDVINDLKLLKNRGDYRDIFSFLNKQCGYKGGNFSGGQSQRILLARELLKNSDVYIFDEPLSALDPELKSQVLNAIFKHTNKKTCFVSIHDYSFLTKFDFILYVGNGTVREISHRECLFQLGANKEG